MAMKDAVVLANCIYNMKDLSDESVKAAFTSYYRQRYPEAENVIKTSSIFTKVMFGHVCILSTDRITLETRIMEKWLTYTMLNNLVVFLETDRPAHPQIHYRLLT